MNALPLIDQRAIEAEIFRALYLTLSAKAGKPAALAAVADAVEALGLAAGKAFAAAAPNGPSFDHFATVLDSWRASGALTVENVRQTGHELTFTVTRCTYVERYRAMGLPEELAGLVSCGRDEPFARGYSPKLALERPQTLAAGAPGCAFRFIWRD